MNGDYYNNVQEIKVMPDTHVHHVTHVVVSRGNPKRSPPRESIEDIDENVSLPTKLLMLQISPLMSPISNKPGQQVILGKVRSEDLVINLVLGRPTCTS